MGFMKILLLNIALKVVYWIDPELSPRTMYAKMIHREFNLLIAFLSKRFDYSEVDDVTSFLMDFYPLMYPGEKALIELKAINNKFLLSEKDGVENLVKILSGVESYMTETRIASDMIKAYYTPHAAGIKSFIVECEYVLNDIEEAS